MTIRSLRDLALALAFATTISGCAEDPLDLAPPTGPATATISMAHLSQVAPMYAIDFVASAASGYDMNDAGDIVGRKYRDTGCGAFCLPPEDIVVWRGGTRILLPLVPGYAMSYQFPSFINNQGLIAGSVGIPGSTTHAAAWVPNGATFTARDLGVFAGTSSAEVRGLDNLGRVVGWATQGGAIPTLTVPFLWTQASGMQDLRALGYPNERPAAMSPGGTVLTWNYWYTLGNPASVAPVPVTPRGFVGQGSNGSVINDAGDQAHFLVTTGSQNLAYPFRLSRGGTWQQISAVPSGHLTRYGMGSINADQDVLLTVASTGMFAEGPAGLAQPFGSRISPAYPGASVNASGTMNAAGQILASASIGRGGSQVVRLTPVTPCGANCLVASSLVLTGQFVQDPAAPGSCFQGGRMYNTASARVTVTSETGAPLANVQVNGRFTDEYWLDSAVVATTNAAGVATLNHRGPCGVGAITFIVQKLTLGTRSLDRTRGMLSAWVIPSIAPPTNQAPVANFTVSCNNTTGSCSLDASSSTDDAGLGNLSFRWTAAGRPAKTGVIITRICSTPVVGCTITETLTAVDGGGLSSTKTLTFSVGGTVNQPPTANFTVSCNAATHTCTLDASPSTDDGGIGNLTFAWTTPGRATKTTRVITRSCFVSACPVTITETLTVTDAGKRTAAISKSVTLP